MEPVQTPTPSQLGQQIAVGAPDAQPCDDGTIDAFWYVIAVLLPIIGLCASVYFLARNTVGPAIALAIVSVTSAVIGAALLAAMM